jgi:hypothetical protein
VEMLATELRIIGAVERGKWFANQSYVRLDISSTRKSQKRI